MNKLLNKKVALSILTILVVTFVLVFFLINRKSESKDYITYEINYGYKIEVPNDWEINKSEKDFYILSNKNLYYSEIKVYKNGFEKTKKMVDEYSINEETLDEKKDNSLISGKEKYSKTLKSKYKDSDETSYLIVSAYKINEDESFIFISEGYNEDVIAEIDKKSEKVFESLLNK